MKQAVILAAGRGSRLGEGIPKCLVKLGNRALIHHQLDALHAVGIDDVCVVVGYGADRVRAALGERCHYIDNPRFDETNSLYSLWLTREWVRGPFLQINCDLVAHPKIYLRMLSASGTALAYDSFSGDGEEHMKVMVRNGLLQDISKKLDPARSCGENLGLLKYDHDGARMVFEEVGALIAGGEERSWAPAAMARLARRLPVHCIDMTGLPWAEIDFVEDVLYARCEVLPELRMAQRAGGAAPRMPGLGAHVLNAFRTMGGVFESLFCVQPGTWVTLLSGHMGNTPGGGPGAAPPFFFLPRRRSKSPGACREGAASAAQRRVGLGAVRSRSLRGGISLAAPGSEGRTRPREGSRWSSNARGGRFKSGLKGHVGEIANRVRAHG